MIAFHLISVALHYAVPFLVILTVLVFVHEMGHFLVARKNGVRVETFSIGFGPEVFGWTDKHLTRWKICWLPLGGYVKMFGDANAASMPGEALESMTPEERAVAFQFKTVGQRAAVVAAGPIANFLFAILVLAGLFMAVGQPYTPPVVGAVVADSAAQRAGFAPGDRIVGINGTKIERFQQVQQIVQLGLNEPLAIDVERAGKLLHLKAVPSIVEQHDNFGHTFRIGQLGLEAKGLEYVRMEPAAALWHAVRQSAVLTGSTLKAVGQMIVGTRTTEELGGPLRIAEMSGEVAQGGVVSSVWFLAVLSINLGLINFFPIPMLDGGHLMFYAVEAVRRRPLAPRIQDYGFRIGLTLVLLLMIFATWNDLVHLKVIQYVANLIS
ncbi:MAG TPA: RIP metalloprotease RseP [Alphaproteobacteria bacterium]|nr:RIP metalloprotease RseP [Alphaproteobacteria bacterium]